MLQTLTLAAHGVTFWVRRRTRFDPLEESQAEAGRRRNESTPKEHHG